MERQLMQQAGAGSGFEAEHVAVTRLVVHPAVIRDGATQGITTLESTSSGRGQRRWRPSRCPGVPVAFPNSSARWLTSTDRTMALRRLAVRPPARPAPFFAEHSVHLGRPSRGVEPVPRLCKAREIDAAGAHRQHRAVGNDRGEPCRVGDGATQNRRPRVDRDHGRIRASSALVTMPVPAPMSRTRKLSSLPSTSNTSEG